MKIAFLLASPSISGGAYVIFQHAAGLSELGHTVDIIFSRHISPEEVEWHDRGKGLHFITYEQAAETRYDFAVATWWQTVYELPRIIASKYVFFVQSIESRFYPDSEEASKHWVEATYALPLPVITEASWIQSSLSERFGSTCRLVRNGIRKDLYSPDGPAIADRDPKRLRVLIEGPLGVPFKNVERTIELCARSAADEIWLLTSSMTPPTNPRISRVFSNVPIQQTGAIYRSCDVLVKLSYVEGMFGPPLEMFHCGGTSIVYNVSGHEEYIRDSENALVLARDDESGVLAAISRLREEPILLERLKRGALATAQGWPDWKQSSREFEAAFQSLAAAESTSPQMIKNLGLVLGDWHARHLFHQAEALRSTREEAHLRRELDKRQQLLDTYVTQHQELLASPELALARSLARVPGVRTAARIVRNRGKSSVS